MSTCKSCDASIRWVVMQDSGQTMPIDVKPRDDGNVRLLGSTDGPSGCPLAAYIRAEESVVVTHRYRSHFASCVNANEHRSSDRTRAQRAGRRRGINT